MNPIGDKKLICEACRSEFSCSAASGSCWCFDVEVVPENLLVSEKIYGNCLCRACLSKFSSEFADKDFTRDEASL
ncbi:MAG TPA: cysteine-rich CWC family protein [Pyrinomonadaceae bacterium]|jgi:hypothetical protein